MRILVTGATGKVGSRLAKRLALRGDQVRAMVRDPGRATALRERRVEIVRGDLLDHSSLDAAVKGVDAVVHCASVFFPGNASEQGHAPDLATLFATVGAPPPDGSAAEAARADEVLLDGRRLREDLGFKPKYPRLQDAMAAGA